MITRDEQESLETGFVIGLVVGVVATALIGWSLELYQKKNHSQLLARADAQVELRVAEKKRELDICQQKLSGYREIAALAEALERARKGER